MPVPLPRGVRIPERTVWLNGHLVRGHDAVVSVFDRGARDEASLFETLRIYDGHPFAWDRHMERLVLSAAELGFPVPESPERLRAAVEQVLAAEGLADAVVRITVTRGIAGGRPVRTGAWVEAEALSGRLWAGARRRDTAVAGAATQHGPSAAAILSPTRFSPGLLGRHKTASRLAWDLAREEARAAGADDALLATPAGELLEGAASNVFVVAAGVVHTPPLGADVLPGITRAFVLECCASLGIAVRESTVPVGMLESADEVFLTNSVQELLPLARVGSRPVPNSHVGHTLLAAYRERVRAERIGAATP